MLLNASRVAAACAVALFLSVPSATDAALARRQVGGTAPVASYSATLSQNPAVRQQQLICDPLEILEGSTSVEYEPAKVSLAGFAYGPGFGPRPPPTAAPFDDAGGAVVAGLPPPLDGFVEVFGGGETFLQPISQFLVQPAGVETGYVQMFYERTFLAPPGQIAPFGPVLDDDPGLGAPGEGVDTHQLLFDVLDAPGLGPATYHVYADDGSRGLEPDFLRVVDTDDPNGGFFRFEAPDIHDATVTAPEPSALSLIGLASLALLRRRR